jgi:DNA repair exonuclease SbcCD ATPase subunit
MELERLRKELEEQEAVVSQYKAANRFALPEQLETNLRSLEQFRRELDSSSHRLSALQERRGVLQKQAVESDILKLDLPGSPFAWDGVTQDVQRDMKKKELDSLLQRYSSKHPDVIRLKKKIQAREVENVELVPSKRSNSPRVANLNPVKEVLRAQIVDIDSKMQVLRSQSDRIRSQIGILQSRVDNTSTRSIELSKISRGYDITLRKY